MIGVVILFYDILSLILIDFGQHSLPWPPSPVCRSIGVSAAVLTNKFVTPHFSVFYFLFQINYIGKDLLHLFMLGIAGLIWENVYTEVICSDGLACALSEIKFSTYA